MRNPYPKERGQLDTSNNPRVCVLIAALRVPRLDCADEGVVLLVF
jgi:hypothetical protein